MVFEVKEIEKRYNDKTVLRQISFQIPNNQITVILGKNGAGKTTLIKLMLGMITADRGEILFRGEKLSELGHAYYQQVSAVLESVDNVYPFLTGKQNIDYFLGLSQQAIAYSDERIQQLIDEFDLRDAIDEPVGGYSRGMLQKLSLIIALMTDAAVLFLDEPTLGLDFQSSKQLCQKIKQLSQEQHKTIILTSHQAEIIELLADHVIVIDEGLVIYDGAYNDFLKQVPHSQEFEAVIEGEVTSHELQCRIEKGKSYIKRNTFDELTSLLGQYDLTSRLIKIERLSPTIEETLDYFYHQGGHRHEAI